MNMKSRKLKKLRKRKNSVALFVQKNFPKKSKLTRHLATHYRKYNCPTCNAIYKRIDRFHSHLEVCNNDLRDTIDDFVDEGNVDIADFEGDLGTSDGSDFEGDAGASVDFEDIEHTRDNVVVIGYDLEEHVVPDDLEEPVVPDDLEEPVVPDDLEEPVVPDDLEEPVVPDDLEEPVVPDDLEEPVVPDDLEEPVVPDDLEEPVVPDDLEEPVVPDDLEEPVVPDDLEEPVVPDDLEEPVVPDDLEKPVVPDDLEEPVVPEMRNCSNWEFDKKRKNLCIVLDKLNKISKADQTKILRKSIDTVDSDVRETLMMTDTDSVNEAKVAVGILEYLKTFTLYRREDKRSFCSLIYHVCGNELSDDHFFAWFCKRINKRPEGVRARVYNECPGGE